ncbi:LacI family DNA-binding transcriptional regulator [Bifidobacterium simiarum]|uniref:LacI family DNA-binding transcriptional regulator n=1 Tax=Bifidobacterium simiarum TaxID=2045441 RepID=UPI001BDC2377|nr:LacI family DNA-binding transcriptional regulator [Bifidobacterium simiarum]MBT1166580.1 LacI family DNA-binding transcriptional regulator [Bifidobacterium simiarum]
MVKSVTIADVAAEAGVSTKTVSNVINRTGRMSDETRERVEEVINRLGYRINKSAQALRSGATKLLGLAVPGFTNPFFGLFCDEVSSYARSKGYGVVISTYGNMDEGLDGLIDETYHVNADGWIFLTDRPLKKRGSVLRQSYPVVLTGDFPAFAQADSVSMPDADGAEYATTWLLDHGCKRVAFLGTPPDLFGKKGVADKAKLEEMLVKHEGNMSLRFRGYIRALREKGIDLDWDLVVPCDFMDRESGEGAMETLLDRGVKVDGVFCANDIIALGAMSVLKLRHISVPDEMQMIGFDNTRDSGHCTPSLTTIDPFAWQYAQMSVDCLLRRIAGDKEKPGLYTTGFRLVERDSTVKA